MQNQGMISIDAIKVLNRQVSRAQGNKIKNAFNMLIRVLYVFGMFSRSNYMACLHASYLFFFFYLLSLGIYG